MTAPIVAESAIARMDALRRYDILDTPTEAEFDDIAHLAADLLETPIAVVNFIAQGRQWFKAEVGIGARELPLDVSICAHAILEEDFLIVPDTRLDPRFAGNPLVMVDDGLRFYAGALLHAADGTALGTVCVLDRVPRPEGITPRQRLALGVLARQVMTILDLRLAMKAQADQVEALRQAELERQLLSEELSHRLKNTLALVQGIASQTLKHVPDRAAVKAFEDRLMALSTAHDILVQDSWASARLHNVIQGGMALHAAGRFAIEGPEVTLGPRGALSVAMLLHELATNALKHGSLSTPEGRIAISWRIEVAEHPVLHLEWRERGGPPATPPATTGFGTKLIAMGLGGARNVTENFEPTGYTAFFSAPLGRLKES